MLLATPAFAEGGPSAETISRLASAIHTSGCKVNADNQAAVLALARMGESEAGVIVSDWIDRGDAVYEDGTLTLLVGLCRP